MLSMFSFVGFESATTLGAEARDPLRTIPRAVLQCALLAGAFFMLCSYSEVLGFRGESGKLSETTSPLHILAGPGGHLAARSGHRFGRVHQHVCLRAGLHHGGGARADAMAHGNLSARVFRTNQRRGMERPRQRLSFPPD